MTDYTSIPTALLERAAEDLEGTQVLIRTTCDGNFRPAGVQAMARELLELRKMADGIDTSPEVVHDPVGSAGVNVVCLACGRTDIGRKYAEIEHVPECWVAAAERNVRARGVKIAVNLTELQAAALRSFVHDHLHNVVHEPRLRAALIKLLNEVNS